MTASRAARFITGSVPGSARTTGSVSVFSGESVARGRRGVNIFERVLTCTWTSRPMTAS